MLDDWTKGGSMSVHGSGDGSEYHISLVLSLHVTRTICKQFSQPLWRATFLHRVGSVECPCVSLRPPCICCLWPQSMPKQFQGMLAIDTSALHVRSFFGVGAYRRYIIAHR